MKKITIMSMLCALTLSAFSQNIFNRQSTKNNNKSNLEKKLDNINHTMELVRTIVPMVILILQVVILIKLFG